ncbi:hypothetical protein LTR08_004588 [Meristemomyces frigidus]|nr:hypothetical protein LTR08_004588 [Meristemomyces frigidus]
MILRHIPLPLTPYTTAATLQTHLVAAQLAHKAAAPTSTPPPHPAVITAQFHPTYTCGRREIGTVSPAQRDYLTATTPWGRAQFHETRRGGQTTFHGPGQLVAYPVLDLQRHKLTPRAWIHLLESAVMSTCAHYGVATARTENPGVWTPAGEKKICAVGVHLRRNVTSHGVGLNVGVELGWFGRIVGCGLEGKGATDLRREMGGRGEVPGVEEVGEVFVGLLAEGLGGVAVVREVVGGGGVIG